MKVEVKLYVPAVHVNDFDKFWDIASEADVKTYNEIGEMYLELMALVGHITFKWRGSIYRREKVDERIVHGLKRYYYEERLPDGTVINRYWMYSTDWEDVRKANFDHYARVINRMKHKIGEGWTKASYLERWLRLRNHSVFKKVEENRTKARRNFIKRLEMYGFISGHIEELDPRDIYEQTV